MIFSGSTLYFDRAGEGFPLQQQLTQGGEEQVMYQLLEYLPGSTFTAILFFLMVFLSFVTAADSNTNAMGGISSQGIHPDSPEPGNAVKISWGLLIGTVSWVMVSSSGIDGIKMISNLGGLPALLLMLGVAGGMIRILRETKSSS